MLYTRSHLQNTNKYLIPHPDDKNENEAKIAEGPKLWGHWSSLLWTVGDFCPGFFAAYILTFCSIMIFSSRCCACLTSWLWRNKFTAGISYMRQFVIIKHHTNRAVLSFISRSTAIARKVVCSSIHAQSFVFTRCGFTIIHVYRIECFKSRISCGGTIFCLKL